MYKNRSHRKIKNKIICFIILISIIVCLLITGKEMCKEQNVIDERNRINALCKEENNEKGYKLYCDEGFDYDENRVCKSKVFFLYFNVSQLKVLWYLIVLTKLENIVIVNLGKCIKSL